MLSSKKGLNRFVWDFRRESLPAVNGVFVYGNYNGSRVGPGAYTVRLTLDSTEVRQEVRVLARPGLQATPAQFAEQQQALVQIEGAIRDMHQAVNQLRSVREQLKGYKGLLKEQEKAKPLLEKGDALLERIKTWEERLIQPDQKTFQDVINFNNRLNAELMYLKSYVDAPLPELTKGARERLGDLLEEWASLAKERDAIVNEEMQGYNQLYRELDLPALIMD